MSAAEWAHIGITGLVTACAAWGAVHAELRVLMRSMERVERQLVHHAERLAAIEARQP